MALSAQSFFSASVVAGALFFVGDVTSQGIAGHRRRKLTEGKHEQTGHEFYSVWNAVHAWDYERTLKMTGFGFGFNGWYSLAGFHLLDRILGPSSTLRQAATKAIISQSFLSPPYLSAFLLYSAVFCASNSNNKESVSTAIDTVVEKFPELYMSAWTVWPAVNLLTFRYLPPGVPRVAFLNFVGVGWNAYMTAVGVKE
ncbi:hypothetical protein BDR26DRAFT_865587 [Obelidium mucronatum]|nr:hypothetical protein BDR26DRAFT_865587 [Obelidium mucronatum]